MFKPIPGNNKYVISLAQDIRYLDGTKVNIPIIDNRIDIELYGVLKNVDLKWLSLIANFETILPSSNVKDLFNVRFTDANIKFFRPVSGKIMYFKRPIVLIRNNKQYRVIPCFTRYAVSCDGEVIEISSGCVIKIVKDLKRHNVIDQYPSVYIYNPERSSYKYVLLHRLVALAWVSNKGNDFVLRPIVNHKDGNKQNFHCSNLEWCSFYENNIHAINNGLRTDNIYCKVRDFTTGIVREFSSLAQASCFMGLSEKSIRVNRSRYVKSRLINGRYEFKLATDKTPWFYENKTEKVKVGRYIIVVTDPSGQIEYFHDLRDFKNKFKIWNCPKVTDMVNKVLMENLGYKIEVIDNYHSEDIQAFDVENNTIIETNTIVGMSKKLGIPEHLIRGCLLSSETQVKNGYAFRYKSNKPWDKNFVKREKKHFKLLAINQNTKEEIKFNSIRHAAKVLKVDRTAIKNSLINNILLRDWLILENKE
jgi:hypothetical protein